MNAKAPCASPSLREKWAEESRARMNQYPSHRTEGRVRNSFPLI